jgi:hypothetical protein
LTVISVAKAMAFAFAHALELPGKMRLSKHQYLSAAVDRSRSSESNLEMSAKCQ